MNSAKRISTRHVEIGTLYFVALLREQLGARIKQARVGAGLTQRELAERIHLKNATDVSRYERGIVEVPSHRIDLIAEATGRPRSFLTRDPTEPEPADETRLSQLEERVAALPGEMADAMRAILRDELRTLLREQQPQPGQEPQPPGARRRRGGSKAA